MRRLLPLCFAVLCALVCAASFAQAWPSKPVRFILSQPPGTGPDIIRACSPSALRASGVSRW